MAALNAIASVESSLEKGSDGGCGMYCGCALSIIIIDSVGAVGCVGLWLALSSAPDGKPARAPSYERAGTGNAGRTFGVVGEYAGATGEEAWRSGEEACRSAEGNVMPAGGGTEKVKVPGWDPELLRLWLLSECGGRGGLIFNDEGMDCAHATFLPPDFYGLGFFALGTRRF